GRQHPVAAGGQVGAEAPPAGRIGRDAVDQDRHAVPGPPLADVELHRPDRVSDDEPSLSVVCPRVSVRMGGDHALVVRIVQSGGVQLSEAIGLASEAAEFLRRQDRPDMAAAVETLRLAAQVATEESLTPSQVARLIGRHRNTVRNWVNWGLIKAVKT